MLFNSLEFFVFFITVFVLYGLSKHRVQNVLLLIASYVFYSFWDWRFLSLIVISTIVDYFCGLKIDSSHEPRARKIAVAISVFCNLAILVFFKYYNFFAESLGQLFLGFGVSLSMSTLHIILPVGISFYTFQTMSYTIDIYRKELKPTRNFLDFALFVSFFPQLVAGPIERAKNLLPQVIQKRSMSLTSIYEGASLVLWGLFQKVFIADNLARWVDPVFAKTGGYTGGEVLLAVYAFAFQILCDFAGYSNIARGISKCLGFEIMVNFNIPYFSINPSEFWKRWHISLSSWLRDYLYIPLGGNRVGSIRASMNLMITMLLGGLWHGAAWTFVIWGVLHGALLISYRVIPFLKDMNASAPRFQRLIGGFVFFHFVCLGWVFFRAQTVDQAFIMIQSLFSFDLISSYFTILWTLIPYVWFLFLIQCYCYFGNKERVVFDLPWPLRSIAYVIMFYSLTQFGAYGNQEFIYFQFKNTLRH